MHGNFYNNEYDDILNNQNNIITSEKYIDDILKLNKGKKIILHTTIPGSNEWQDKTFEGIIENIGKDHIVMSNPQNGEWYLVPMIYTAFITFLEEVNNNSSLYG